MTEIKVSDLTAAQLSELLRVAVRDGVRDALCNHGGSEMPVFLHTQPPRAGKEYGGGGGYIARMGHGGG